MTPCSFDLHFSDSDVEHIFVSRRGHVYLLFGEMTRSFAYFLIRLCFFGGGGRKGIEVHELFVYFED